MEGEQKIADEYPLHYQVWNNDAAALANSALPDSGHLEQLDPRGRTPLMLAVTFGYVDCARVLIQAGANVNVENSGGWTVVQEASATGIPELLQLVLEKRDHQRHNNRMLGVPALLHQLREAPDFYMEMKWEFTSWLPLVSRLCPSDTYKVYKQGSKVRIDTTLLGFDQNSWQRGSFFALEAPKILWGRRSFVYQLQAAQDKALMLEMDHENKEVYAEELLTVSEGHQDYLRQAMMPSEQAISVRLTTPLVHTYIDTEKISFERNKCGIWGWRSDKTEVVNGRESKVYSATNVELVTKTRVEHLSHEDRTANRSRAQRFPLQSLLGVAQLNQNEVEGAGAAADPTFSSASVASSLVTDEVPTLPLGQVTMAEYFDASVDLGERDIGRAKEMTTKIQKFRANLWLCDAFPLSLPEQIMPIVDLMAISSSHFAKLKNFIQMQLPSGFPIKIEIPLFHVMNACVTFGNVFGIEESVVGVSTIEEIDRLSCVVDDSCFEAPADYVVYGSTGNAATATATRRSTRHQFSMDEDDELLQFAIQKSLIEAGTESDQVDIWEALKGQKPSRPSTPQPAAARGSPLPARPCSALGINLSAEEEQLQRAIAASLQLDGGVNATAAASTTTTMTTTTTTLSPADRPSDAVSTPGSQEAAALAHALELSARESQLEELRRKEEDEMLQRILELSLVEH